MTFEQLGRIKWTAEPNLQTVPMLIIMMRNMMRNMRNMMMALIMFMMIVMMMTTVIVVICSFLSLSSTCLQSCLSLSERYTFKTFPYINASAEPKTKIGSYLSILVSSPALPQQSIRFTVKSTISKMMMKPMTTMMIRAILKPNTIVNQGSIQQRAKESVFHSSRRSLLLLFAEY